MATVYHRIYFLGTSHEAGLYSYCFHDCDTSKLMGSNQTNLKKVYISKRRFDKFIESVALVCKSLIC